MGGKTSQSTSQVQIPPEVLARYNSVNATAEQTAATPFKQYSTDPNAFVAPVNAQQNAGIAGTNAAANQAQPYFGAATAYTAAGGQAVDPNQLGGQQINQFLSPFLGDVYGATLAGENQQNAQQASGLQGTAIGAGAFGGDRSGVAAANLAYQQNLANSQTNANILNTGFNTALGAAQQQQDVNLGAEQANRAALQQTGQSLAGLGAGAQTAALQGAQAQLGAGAVQQQTTQAGDTALYNQFLQQQAYPFQTAQFLANIAEGTGALSGSTTNTTQPSTFFSAGGRRRRTTSMWHRCQSRSAISARRAALPSARPRASAGPLSTWLRGPRPRSSNSRNTQHGAGLRSCLILYTRGAL